MKQFGLIGYPLTHSFSKRYFTDKFAEMGISDTHQYDLFELEDYRQLPELIATHPHLRGLNVTIPHKQNVQPYLDEINDAARRIGAVNVIKITPERKLIGYNSDYYGFRQSLEEAVEQNGLTINNALILGNGGAAKAVKVALEDMGIPYKAVSRTPSEDTIGYADVAALLPTHELIVNTTPVGTYPKTDVCPDIPYENLTAAHFLYDLVYNPAETLFMQKGATQGATTLNGYRMLVLQAEKSWEIWNSRP